MTWSDNNGICTNDTLALSDLAYDIKLTWPDNFGACTNQRLAWSDLDCGIRLTWPDLTKMRYVYMTALTWSDITQMMAIYKTAHLLDHQWHAKIC